jgi:hypothetical protein
MSEKFSTLAYYKRSTQHIAAPFKKHILRLITERLHLGLDKRQGVDPGDPDTWRLTASEIRDLAEAMSYLHGIKNTLQSDKDTI